LVEGKAMNESAGDSLAYDDVAPDASAMIESMRAHGYTLPSAVADLIDNSIAANARHVWLDFHWNGADSWVTVTDDGDGMTEDELRDAMRLGSRNPLLAREPGDLGRFGLGMKTASLSQCRRLTVASRRAGEDLAIRRWDLDHIAREDVVGWQLLRCPQQGSEQRLKKLEDEQTGTVVLWELMDRVVGRSERDDARAQDHFLGLVGDVEAHLAMVFHRYLASSGKTLAIEVNGENLPGWDPFLETHPSTQPTPEETIRLPEGDIRVRGFVLPHKDRLGQEIHALASGPAGWNAQQGFYVYRNQRLIVPGSWLGLGRGRSWTKEEHYKLARIRIDIPNSMDHLWQIDVKKSAAIPPAQIRDRLRQLADSVRQDARGVFSHRGKYGPRAGAGELQRPWKARKTRDGFSYRIDRKHPLVAAVISERTGGERRRMEAMLRVLEETVPVQQIWLDTAEDPDNPTRPFAGTTDRQIGQIIREAYDAIRRNQGLTHDQTIGLLMSMEEFSEQDAVIATLEDRS